jgi:hypothetical protein
VPVYIFINSIINTYIIFKVKEDIIIRFKVITSITIIIILKLIININIIIIIIVIIRYLLRVYAFTSLFSFTKKVFTSFTL